MTPACSICKSENTKVVEADADGSPVLWWCQSCGWSTVHVTRGLDWDSIGDLAGKDWVPCGEVDEAGNINCEYTLKEGFIE